MKVSKRAILVIVIGTVALGVGFFSRYFHGLSTSGGGSSQGGSAIVRDDPVAEGADGAYVSKRATASVRNLDVTDGGFLWSDSGSPAMLGLVPPPVDVISDVPIAVRTERINGAIDAFSNRLAQLERERETIQDGNAADIQELDMRIAGARRALKLAEFGEAALRAEAAESQSRATSQRGLSTPRVHGGQRAHRIP